ncbi:MAG: DUF6410 domain-containing protein, partial [Marinobacter sp.]|nr:DUF6410 domain-containing protein [Marinobacter sp.]
MLAENPDIAIGREVGVVGRWFRLVIGLYFSLLVTVVAVLGDPISDALSFLGQVGLYFLLFLAIYLVAFRVLSGRILGRTDPWVGTLIFLGPVAVIGAFELGPAPFRVGLSLYYSLSSILNFAMSYGGCEVVALPSLIFRTRYTLYCPYNAVDVVENALLKGSATNQAFGILSLAITVLIGGYFLLVEDQGLFRQFYPLDLPNQLALILLVPLGFIIKNGWETYQAAGKKWTRDVNAYSIGGLVLFVLMIMFVIGEDAFPLWY